MAVTAISSLRTKTSMPRLSEVLPAEWSAYSLDKPFGDRDLKAALAGVDISIDALRKPLFALAAKVVQRSRTAYPSSLVIDDASGRFVGRFIAQVLKAEKPVPVLCLRMINSTIFEGWNREHSLRSWMKINSERLGARPLIVSEILETGEHLAIAAALMNERGKTPDVAVLMRRASTVLSLLVFPMDVIGSIAQVIGECRSFSTRVNGLVPTRAHLHRASISRHLAAPRIGKVLVGVTCYSRLGADLLAPQTDNNEKLNGIGSSHFFNPDDPLYRPVSFIQRSNDAEDRKRRAQVIRHSRVRLKELASEFWGEYSARS